jgi:hypothetical protein
MFRNTMFPKQLKQRTAQGGSAGNGRGTGVCRPHRFAGIFISGLMCFVLLATWSWGTVTTEQVEASKIEDVWGIQIVGIRQTAAGHMLDFRYRVVDAGKAAPLFVRQIQPYLIDESSGKSLTVPNMAKVGPLRSSNKPLQGRTYWMFFGNPGLVKAGSKVSVVIGDFRVQNLTVR